MIVRQRVIMCKTLRRYLINPSIVFLPENFRPVVSFCRSTFYVALALRLRSSTSDKQIFQLLPNFIERIGDVETLRQAELVFVTSSGILFAPKSTSEAIPGEPAGSTGLQQLLNQINMSRSCRWFENPYLDLSPKTDAEAEGDLSRFKKYGLELMEKAFSKGCKDGDGGLYVGAVGVAYMYLHVSHILTREERQNYLPLAFNAFQTQANYYQANPVGRNDLPAFLLGKGGFFAVGAVLSHEVGNEGFKNDCLKSYLHAAHICKPINFFSHGGDELFVGRAGYLCGALWLQQKLGYMPLPKQELRNIWNSIVESGQTYAQHHMSPAPLMYSYYDTEYLGAAHGLCAILQMLLSFPTFLSENPAAEQLIKNSVDYYLTLQDASGNFPCALDEVGPGRARGDQDMLLHWCHGAPGAIYLFGKAYLHYKEQKYLDACIQCGEAVWKRGLLRKGPGICHGVAGNGYVFLVIYNLLEGKDPKYLYRAMKFGDFLLHPQFLKESRRPDKPYSLYEGIAGTACYVMDLLQAKKAEFPFFNLNNNYV